VIVLQLHKLLRFLRTEKCTIILIKHIHDCNSWAFHNADVAEITSSTSNDKYDLLTIKIFMFRKMKNRICRCWKQNFYILKNKIAIFCMALVGFRIRHLTCKEGICSVHPCKCKLQYTFRRQTTVLCTNLACYGSHTRLMRHCLHTPWFPSSTDSERWSCQS